MIYDIFQQYFIYIMVVSFIGGRNRSTRRKLLIRWSSMRKMRSTKSPSLKLFSDITPSIYRIVKLKDRANFFRFSWEAPIWIKSSSYEKMNKSARRGSTNRNVGCLLKNRSTKHSKYAINQKLEHFDDISFREYFCRRWVYFLLQKKICLYLRQSICIYVSYSFFNETQLN